MLLLINRRACHMFLLMLQERVIIDGLQYDAVRREIASFKLPHRAWDKLNRMGQLSTCSLPDGAWARSLLAGKSALNKKMAVRHRQLHVVAPGSPSSFN